MHDLTIKTETWYMVMVALDRSLYLSKDHLSIKTAFIWPKGGRIRQVPLYNHNKIIRQDNVDAQAKGMIITFELL